MQTTLEDLQRREAAGTIEGFYYDLDSNIYHDPAAPGISNSGLTRISKSPATFIYEKTNPPPETKALRDGKMYHCCILEPDRFESVYVAKPDREKRSNVDKAWWIDFEARIAEEKMVIMPAEDIDNAKRMRDFLFKDQRALNTLQGLKEVTAFVREFETKVLCKAKADVINPMGSTVEFKTTTDCSPDGFAKDMASYRYHVQNVFHMDVINQTIMKTGPIKVGSQLINKIKNPILFVVEKDPPYNFERYVLNLDDLQHGFDIYKRDLAVYAECLKTNVWPATSGVIKEIRLPVWARKKVE